MTLQDLKKAKMQEMKARNADAVTGLNVVIAKLMLLEKSGKGEITDADVNQAIQKSIKELQEEKEGFAKAGRAESVASLEAQIKAVQAYLPKQLSAEEIKDIILGLDDKSVPSVMRYFKEKYQGQVDMKEVSVVLKSL